MPQHNSTETPEILALQTAFQSIAKSVATSIVDALVQPLQQEIESKVNAIIAEATKDIHNKIAAAIGCCWPGSIFQTVAHCCKPGQCSFHLTIGSILCRSTTKSVNKPAAKV